MATEAGDSTVLGIAEYELRKMTKEEYQRIQIGDKVLVENTTHSDCAGLVWGGTVLSLPCVSLDVYVRPDEIFDEVPGFESWVKAHLDEGKNEPILVSLNNLRVFV